MRLLDSVIQAEASFGVAAPDGTRFLLPGAGSISQDVHAAPLRYVLDEEVAGFAAALAFEETARFLDLLDLVRLPAHGIWIEWDDAARAQALRRAGFADAATQRRRAGVLISGAADGRVGAIRSVWVSESGEPELSPVVMEFDLEDSAYIRRAAADDGPVYDVALSSHEPLEVLFGHARFRFQSEWWGYYQHLRLNVADLDKYVAANLECVAADFPFAMGLLLTLSARNALAFERTLLERLNRARAKSGKAALLEHTMVFACLERNGGAWTAPPGARREARQHFVSGHLVRRGDQVFWRRSHLRGNPGRGVVLGRSIHLRMSPAAAHASI